MKRVVFACLLVLLAAWAIWRLGQPSGALQAMPPLPAWEREEVYAIELMPHGREAMQLVQRQGTWFIREGESEVAADAAAVAKLLDDLEGMRPVRLVTRKAQHYRDLGVGEGSARVILKRQDGAILLDMRIGKPASDLVSTYIRLADAAAVLAVNRSLSWQVHRNRKDWQAVEGGAKQRDAAAPAQP